MNEIALQIIEIGKLIGKKVFVKHYHDGTFYNDNEFPVTFMVDDFKYYAYGIFYGEIEIINIKYTAKLGRYYLVTFKDL